MADTPSQIFQRLREQAGLTQAQAARLLHVHTQTVSRWERGERQIKARDLEEARRLFKMSEGLSRNVPRGTKPSEELSGWDQLLGRFEREIIRMGATDMEADFVIAALSTKAAFKLCTEDAIGREYPREKVQDEWVRLFRSMIPWIEQRIDERKAAAEAEQLELRQRHGVVVAGKKPNERGRSA